MMVYVTCVPVVQVWVAVKDSGTKKIAKVGWQIAHKTDLIVFLIYLEKIK